MKLTVSPELKQWLKKKKTDAIHVGVVVCRGGCCGGAGYIDTLVYLGEPKEKLDKYLAFQEDGLNVYVAQLMERKTDHLIIGLKGMLFKRPVLENIDPACQ